MFRTMNIKLNELEYDDLFNIALSFSKMLNVDIYLVNDVRPDDLIHIMRLSDKKRESIIPDDSESWLNAYKTFRLL